MSLQKHFAFLLCDFLLSIIKPTIHKDPMDMSIVLDWK